MPVASGSLTLLETKILSGHLDIGMHITSYVQIDANFEITGHKQTSIKLL